MKLDRERPHSFILPITLIALVTASMGVLQPLALQAETSEYMCRPCGCQHDDEVFDEPGSCPSCGMALVPRNHLVQVGILVFDGVQIIDYTAPYEVFGQVSQMRPFTVATSQDPITTAMGMEVIPSHSFESAPPIDILVVPGGNIHGVEASPEAIAWVKRTAEGADHVLTVCNGAFILAATGLLDGQRATTFYGLIDELQRQAPEVEVVRGERFVDNGKIITTAGLSSGIEGSLHLVSKLRGEAAAKNLALHLEYDWRPDSNFARAALADLRMPQLVTPSGVTSRVVHTEGDRSSWERHFELSTELSHQELLDNLRSQIASQNNWRPIEGQALTWESRDTDGVSWRAKAAIEALAAGRYLLKTRVDRIATSAAPAR